MSHQQTQNLGYQSSSKQSIQQDSNSCESDLFEDPTNYGDSSACPPSIPDAFEFLLGHFDRRQNLDPVNYHIFTTIKSIYELYENTTVVDDDEASASQCSHLKLSTNLQPRTTSVSRSSQTNQAKLYNRDFLTDGERRQLTILSQNKKILQSLQTRDNKL